jgi:hypothetical protein
MYIAVCSFDKSITIFDFFSGDLVAQVHGHSELITNIKFSPDGRKLISVAGDGCVFVWSISLALVPALEYIIKELYTSAQRRQSKLNRQLEVAPHPGTEVSLMPPAPPPASSSAVPAASTSPTVAGKLHPSLLSKHRDSRSLASKHPSEVAAQSKGVVDADANKSMEVIGTALGASSRLRLGAKKVAADSVSGLHPGSATVGVPTEAPPKRGEETGGSSNKWAVRNSQEGYELFGRKILPESSRNRNQFTLELDPDEYSNVSVDIGRISDADRSTIDDNDVDRALGILDNDDHGLAGSTKLARTLEAADDVVLHISDDEDDDDVHGDKLFKPQNERPENPVAAINGDPTKENLDKEARSPAVKMYVSGSDFDVASVVGDEEDDLDDELDGTSSKLESLDRSAMHLESWLEDVVRCSSSFVCYRRYTIYFVASHGRQTG